MERFLQPVKTTELIDIEQALKLIEHVLLRSGDEGEYLVPASGGGEGAGRSLVQQRLATRKSLLAAKNLLSVATKLMENPRQSPGKEVAVQIKAAIETLKVAARGAYEAGHLLVGVSKEPT
jgi:hypothetical protein